MCDVEDAKCTECNLVGYFQIMEKTVEFHSFSIEDGEVQYLNLEDSVNEGTEGVRCMYCDHTETLEGFIERITADKQEVIS